MAKVDLGDYVHYRNSRYRLFGISSNDTRKRVNAQTAYNNQINSLKKYILNRGTESGAQILQNGLNNLIPTLTMGNPDENSSSNKLRQALLEELQTKSAIIEPNLDRFIGKSIDGSLTLEEIEKELRPFYKEKNENASRRISTINKRLDQLTKLYNNITVMKQNINTGKSNIKTLQRALDQIAAIIVQLNADLDEVNFKTEKTIIHDRNIDNLIDNFNKARKKLIMPPQTYTGDIGELGTAGLLLLMTDKINDLSVEEIQNLLRKSKVGIIKSPTGFARQGNFLNLDIIVNEMNIDKNKTHRTIYKKNTYHDNDGKERYNSLLTNNSSQTVDISVDLGDDGEISKALGINQLNASVKNYNMSDIKHPTIKLLTGAPLTSILNLLDTEFTNHYLNMIAQQIELEGTETNFENYTETIKKAALIRALAGETRISEGLRSDYFIIHDNSKNAKNKPYKVFSTKALYDRIDINKDLLASGLPAAHSLSNKWQSPNGFNRNSAINRISYLIGTVHKQKINLSLNKTFFNKL